MSLKYKTAVLVCLLAFGELGVSWRVFASPQESVASAIFTTAIEERAPVDQVLLLNNKTNKIFFYTDLRHFENQKIIHRWEYGGKVVLSKTFEVKAPRWQVYSIKNLSPEQLGKWRVVVTNEKGWPLKATIFKYVDGGAEGNVILPFSE